MLTPGHYYGEARISTYFLFQLARELFSKNERQLKLPEQINRNIYLVQTANEQQAIAEVLSDADALIASLERLIEKKKNSKQLLILFKSSQNHLEYRLDQVVKLLVGRNTKDYWDGAFTPCNCWA